MQVRKNAAQLATTLFIHGGDDFARHVFRTEQRGYWSQALPLVLEKHGYLAVESAGPEALRDPELLRSFGAVLVSRLPEGSWTPEAAEHALRGPVPFLVEGPLPALLERALGVESQGNGSASGSVRAVEPGLQRAAERFGLPAGGEVRENLSRPLERESELNWEAIDAVPLSEPQAAAWRARSWDVRTWAVSGDAEVLAGWRPSQGGATTPALVRRGSLTGCAFGLFGYLGEGHTSEPFEGAEHRMSARRTGLEALLLALIDHMHARSNSCRVRVLPWPAGTSWVMNMRHDYDRRVGRRALRRLLKSYERLGVASTWYWRPLHAESKALAAVASHRQHEIALHTERVWAAGGDGEKGRLEAASGRRVVGTAAHGGSDCFRYQGAPNLLWAQQQGFLYSEVIQHAHLHPHRFGELRADGTIGALDVICLPHHESFDRSMRPGETQAERIRTVLPEWIRAAGMLQLMNHPDIHQRELLALLAELPGEGRADWTAAQTCEWWRRTHVGGHLTLSARPDGAVAAQALQGADGVVVELLSPEGVAVEHVLDLAPGVAQLIGPPTRDAPGAAAGSRR